MMANIGNIYSSGFLLGRRVEAVENDQDCLQLLADNGINSDIQKCI